MQKVKQLFLKNLAEITRSLEYSTDKSAELGLLIILFLFGEKSINASPLSRQRKRRLYKSLRELKEGTELNSVYQFFQKTVLSRIIPLLKAHGKLSRLTRKYRKQFIISVDDTSLKVFGKTMEKAKKLHDGKGYFHGYHIVFIGLSLGASFRIPIAFRIYIPNSGVTRPQLAAEMLNELIPLLPITPEVICFDSAYYTQTLNVCISEHGLFWVTKSKYNWKYALTAHDYELLTGQTFLFPDMYYSCTLSARELVVWMQAVGLVVLRVFRKNIGKLLLSYDSGNRILVSSAQSVTANMIRLHYRLRWTIEETFRVLKQHLSFTLVYQRDLVGQALFHALKILGGIWLLCLRNESRTLKNMTFNNTQKTLRNLFISDSKYGQSPYSELLKYSPLK